MNGTDDEFYDKMHEIIDSISDPRIKDYLENYLKTNEEEFIHEFYSAAVAEDFLFGPKEILTRIALEGIGEQVVGAYCEEQLAKLPKPNEKTERFLSVMEHFVDDDVSDIQRYVQLRELTTLAADPEVDPNAATFNLGNPLILAVSSLGYDKFVNSSKKNRDAYIKIITTLIERGTDINKACVDGTTPALAAQAQPDVIKLLHEHGADIMVRAYCPVINEYFGWGDDEGPGIAATNLMALDNDTDKRIEVIYYLLDNGLDPNDESDPGLRFSLNMLANPDYVFDMKDQEFSDSVSNLNDLCTIIKASLTHKYCKEKEEKKVCQADYAKYIKSYMENLVQKMQRAFDLDLNPEALRIFSRILTEFCDNMNLN